MSNKHKHTPKNYDVNQFYIPDAASEEVIDKQPDPMPIHNLGKFAIAAGLGRQLEPPATSRNDIGVL